MQMHVTVQNAHIELVPAEPRLLETAASIELSSLGDFVERLRDQGCGAEEVEKALSGLEEHGGAVVWIAEI
jgi:hypothetical protein